MCGIAGNFGNRSASGATNSLQQSVLRSNASASNVSHQPPGVMAAHSLAGFCCSLDVDTLGGRTVLEGTDSVSRQRVA